MKKVKQKLEEQKTKIENKFPELIVNQMHLGTAEHPNFKLWEQTVSKVGYDTLEKWKKLRYALNCLNSINHSNYNLVKEKIDYVLKEFKMYNLAKMLRKELAN